MKKIVWFLVVAFLLFSFSFAAFGQTTEFTYQGSLKTADAPANGNFDFEFALFNVATGSSPIAATITRTNVAVTNGVFSVSLNFGDSFNGLQRFLEIRVRPSGGGAFTVLAPRQQFLSAPYSLYSRNAENALFLSGVTASEFTLTTDSRLSDARQPLPGSANYIQNTTTQQTSSNFNISGTGTANVFNAATQYNLGGARFLSSSALSGNTLLGFNTGPNTTGTNNSFFGSVAGFSNTTGDKNSFFGSLAGRSNTSGFSNSFFGTTAGFSNTTGASNSFFGEGAGAGNTTGNGNSFFGRITGSANTTGGSNSYYGFAAGEANTIGNNNAFFGLEAGRFSTGNNNSFFGTQAGKANTSDNNSFFGFQAGLVNTTGGGNSFFGVTSGADNTTGSDNAFFGINSGRFNTTGIRNSFFGRRAGNANTTGINNTFVGFSSGDSNITGSNNTTLGANANISEGLSNATAIGAGALATQSNSLILGSISGINGATASTNIGIGTTAPNEKLQIAVNGGNILFGDGGCTVGFTGIGFASSFGACSNYSLLGNGTDTLINRPAGGSIIFRENNVNQMGINSGGTVFIVTLGSSGSTQLCRNGASVISTCSSSIRYKTNISDFKPGLSLIRNLRPVSFDWKDSGMRDFGLVAEEVATIEPLLTTQNEKGETEGVKYDRVGVVLVNAVKEQQAQIESLEKKVETQNELIKRQQAEAEIQNEKIKRQQAQLDALKQFICSQNPAAVFCSVKIENQNAEKKDEK